MKIRKYTKQTIEGKTFKVTVATGIDATNPAGLKEYESLFGKDTKIIASGYFEYHPASEVAWRKWTTDCNDSFKTVAAAKGEVTRMAKEVGWEDTEWLIIEGIDWDSVGFWYINR